MDAGTKIRASRAQDVLQPLRIVCISCNDFHHSRGFYQRGPGISQRDEHFSQPESSPAVSRRLYGSMLADRVAVIWLVTVPFTYESKFSSYAGGGLNQSPPPPLIHVWLILYIGARSEECAKKSALILTKKPVCKRERSIAFCRFNSCESGTLCNKRIEMGDGFLSYLFLQIPISESMQCCMLCRDEQSQAINSHIWRLQAS